MITNAFLGFGTIVVDLIIGILPDWQPDILTSFVDAFTVLFGYVNSLNFILPVTELFLILVFVVHFEIYMFGVRLLLWVLRFIPFLRGRAEGFDRHSRDMPFR